MARRVSDIFRLASGSRIGLRATIRAEAYFLFVFATTTELSLDRYAPEQAFPQ
jgi:hypothetical protein